MNEAVKDHKYVVFKRDELGGLPADLYDELFSRIEQVEDAVVIRTQDVFSAPALDAYANSIQVSLEIADPKAINYHYLKEVADYFHIRAAEAWLHARKIPD